MSFVFYSDFDRRVVILSSETSREYPNSLHCVKQATLPCYLPVSTNEEIIPSVENMEILDHIVT